MKAIVKLTSHWSSGYKISIEEDGLLKYKLHITNEKGADRVCLDLNEDDVRELSRAFNSVLR